jgi:hypothetical protein
MSGTVMAIKWEDFSCLMASMYWPSSRRTSPAQWPVLNGQYVPAIEQECYFQTTIRNDDNSFPIKFDDMHQKIINIMTQHNFLFHPISSKGKQQDQNLYP